MIGAGCKVWAVTWVDKRFPGQLKQLLACDVGSVGSVLAVKEADGALFRPLAFSLTAHPTQFLAIQLCSIAGAGWQQFKQHHTLHVRSD